MVEGRTSWKFKWVCEYVEGLRDSVRAAWRKVMLRQSRFWLKSTEDDDVSVPILRPPPVSLDEGDGQSEGEVRDVQGERGRESASQMVARMLSTPTPSRPSLAHEGPIHSTQRLPDECIWEPSEPRSDPPEEHPVTEDAAQLHS